MENMEKSEIIASRKRKYQKIRQKIDICKSNNDIIWLFEKAGLYVVNPELEEKKLLIENKLNSKF